MHQLVKIKGGTDLVEGGIQWFGSRSETILFNEVPLAKSFWSKVANRRCFEVLERNSKRLNFLYALIRDFSVNFYRKIIGNFSMLF